MDIKRYMVVGDHFSCWLVEKYFWGLVKFAVLWVDTEKVTHYKEFGTADEARAFIELKDKEGREGV